MAKAIRFHQTGGPEVLVTDYIDIGEPQANEILINHTAIGLNYLDTYHRSGLYPHQYYQHNGVSRRILDLDHSMFFHHCT